MASHPPPLLKANFNPSSVGWIVAIFISVLLLALLVLTSYYTVRPDSQGVVLRFGKFLKTVEPGLHFKLPFWIDRVPVVPTRTTLHAEFSFTTAVLLTN